MFTVDFFKIILGLDSQWKIEDVSIDNTKNRIDLLIKYVSKTGSISATLNKDFAIYDFAPERTWRHLNVLQYSCYLKCKLPRVKTEDGKYVTIQAPWADKFKSYTYMFECMVIDLLKATKNQTKTGELLNCGFSIVNSILHNSSKRGMENRKSDYIAFKNLSIDEKFVGEKLKYASILCCPDSGIVLDVEQGRTKKATKTLINKVLTNSQQKAVATISMDMWQSYINVSKELLSNASIVHDRFHLIKYLNKAIDQIRRKEVKDNPILKNARYVLLKNETNLTNKQQLKFDIIKRENLLVSTAWKARENFKGLFNYHNSKGEARLLLQLWINQTKQYTSKAILKVVDTFRNHFEGVANALCLKNSNALAERINGKIQEIKSSSRGYRTFENLRSAILFFHGGLSLYPTYKSNSH